jgi:hypothetical protein
VAGGLASPHPSNVDRSIGVFIGPVNVGVIDTLPDIYCIVWNFCHPIILHIQFHPSYPSQPINIRAKIKAWRWSLLELNIPAP